MSVQTPSYSGILDLGGNITFQGALGVTVERNGTNASVNVNINSNSYIYAPNGCGYISVYLNVYYNGQWYGGTNVLNATIYQNVTTFSECNITVPMGQSLDNANMSFSIYIVDTGGHSGNLYTSTYNFTFNKGITNCTNPTSVTLKNASGRVNRLIPGETLTLSWSGASAGVNNAISKYELTIGSTTSTISSTATSGTATVVAPSSRGSTYAVSLKVIPTQSGYGPSSGTSATSISINKLPSAPTISPSSAQTIASTSSGVSVSISDGSDSEDTITYYYTTSSSSTKTYCGSSATINPSAGSSITYNFYSYDGYEYSSSATSITVTKNTKPTITGQSYTTGNGYTYYNGTQVSTFNTTLTLSSISLNSGHSISSFQWGIVRNDSDTVQYNHSSFSQTSGSILDLFNLESNSDISFKLKMRVYDGYEYTDYKIIDNVLTIPANNSTITTYNQHANSNLGSSVKHQNYFYNLLRFKYYYNAGFAPTNLYYRVTGNDSWTYINATFGSEQHDSNNQYAWLDVTLPTSILTSTTATMYDFKLEFKSATSSKAVTRSLIFDSDTTSTQAGEQRIKIPLVNFTNVCTSNTLEAYINTQEDVMTIGIAGFASSTDFCDVYGIASTSDMPQCSLTIKYGNNSSIIYDTIDNSSVPGCFTISATTNNQLKLTVNQNSNNSRDTLINNLNTLFGQSLGAYDSKQVSCTLKFKNIFGYENTYTYNNWTINCTKAPVINSSYMTYTFNSNTYQLSSTNSWSNEGIDYTLFLQEGMILGNNTNITFWNTGSYDIHIYYGLGTRGATETVSNYIEMGDTIQRSLTVSSSNQPMTGTTVTLDLSSFSYELPTLTTDNRYYFKIQINFNNLNVTKDASQCDNIKFVPSSVQLNNCTFTATPSPGYFHVTKVVSGQVITSGIYTTNVNTLNVILANSTVSLSESSDDTYNNNSTIGTDWAKQNLQLSRTETLSQSSSGVLLATISKTISSNIFYIYNTMPTVAYRSNSLGINTKDVDNDEVIIINPTTTKKLIHFNTDVNVILTLDLSTGELTGPSISGRVPTINLVTGTISGFEYSDALLLTTES